MLNQAQFGTQVMLLACMLALVYALVRGLRIQVIKIFFTSFRYMIVYIIN